MNSFIKAGKQSGFTLIELMITLAILAFMITLGSFFTISWIDQSKVNNTAAVLKSSVSYARSAALRNKSNTYANEPAISICIDQIEHKIRVNRVTNKNDLCHAASADEVLKKIEIAKGISITQGDEPVSVLVINSNGMQNLSLSDAVLEQEINVQKGKELAHVRML
jgi:prepilin-type N-terminal cleavage/methylation domain-containing protein